MLQLHPLGAVGIVMLPVDTPVHDVPVVTKNAAVLFAVMVGEVQNPLAMVGAVEEMIRLPAPSLYDDDESPVSVPTLVMFGWAAVVTVPAVVAVAAFPEVF